MRLLITAFFKRAPNMSFAITDSPAQSHDLNDVHSPKAASASASESQSATAISLRAIVSVNPVSSARSASAETVIDMRDQASTTVLPDANRTPGLSKQMKRAIGAVFGLGLLSTAGLSAGITAGVMRKKPILLAGPRAALDSQFSDKMPAKFRQFVEQGCIQQPSSDKYLPLGEFEVTNLIDDKVLSLANLCANSNSTAYSDFTHGLQTPDHKFNCHSTIDSARLENDLEQLADQLSDQKPSPLTKSLQSLTALLKPIILSINATTKGTSIQFAITFDNKQLQPVVRDLVKNIGLNQFLRQEHQRFSDAISKSENPTSEQQNRADRSKALIKVLDDVETTHGDNWFNNLPVPRVLAIASNLLMQASKLHEEPTAEQDKLSADISKEHAVKSSKSCEANLFGVEPVQPGCDGTNANAASDEINKSEVKTALNPKTPHYLVIKGFQLLEDIKTSLATPRIFLTDAKRDVPGLDLSSAAPWQQALTDPCFRLDPKQVFFLNKLDLAPSDKHQLELAMSRATYYTNMGLVDLGFALLDRQFEDFEKTDDPSRQLKDLLTSFCDPNSKPNSVHSSLPGLLDAIQSPQGALQHMAGLKVAQAYLKHQPFSTLSSGLQATLQANMRQTQETYSLLGQTPRLDWLNTVAQDLELSQVTVGAARFDVQPVIHQSQKSADVDAYIVESEQESSDDIMSQSTQRINLGQHVLEVRGNKIEAMPKLVTLIKAAYESPSLRQALFEARVPAYIQQSPVGAEAAPFYIEMKDYSGDARAYISGGDQVNGLFIKTAVVMSQDSLAENVQIIIHELNHNLQPGVAMLGRQAFSVPTLGKSDSPILSQCGGVESSHNRHQSIQMLKMLREAGQQRQIEVVDYSNDALSCQFMQSNRNGLGQMLQAVQSANHQAFAEPLMLYKNSFVELVNANPQDSAKRVEQQLTSDFSATSDLLLQHLMLYVLGDNAAAEFKNGKVEAQDVVVPTAKLHQMLESYAERDDSAALQVANARRMVGFDV